MAILIIVVCVAFVLALLSCDGDFEDFIRAFIILGFFGLVIAACVTVLLSSAAPPRGAGPRSRPIGTKVPVYECSSVVR